MTARERFHAIMSFNPTAEIPLWDLEGVAEGAVRQWCLEGFPPGQYPQDYFHFDSYQSVPLDTGPVPAYVPRVIAEDDYSRTSVDQYGFTLKTLKHQTVAPVEYYYVAAPIASREDWERMKARLDPADLRRYPKSWSEELLAYYRELPSPVGLNLTWGPGRGVKNGYMMGTERFLLNVADNSSFVADIFSFWADFCIELLRPFLQGPTVDFIFIHEDGMGYKNGTLVSPASYDRLWLPYVKQVVDFIRSRGVKYVGYYSSGDLSPLIPSFLKAGMNLLAPLEVAANMDARALRKQYGRDLTLMGNIGRAALMAGPEATEQEFLAKVPELFAQGGYLPAIDDMILPDISLASFTRYVELIRAYRR